MRGTWQEYFSQRSRRKNKRNLSHTELRGWNVEASHDFILQARASIDLSKMGYAVSYDGMTAIYIIVINSKKP